MKNILKIYMALLSIFLLYNAQGQDRQLTLEMRMVFGKKPLVLEKEKYVTSAGDTVQVDLFRCYISSVE
ncbi:MAG: hypothetical protein ACJ76F_09485, partial [Bacteroidia bacterium]